MARRVDLLVVLGNETRRKILELLAREPKYLLQLSKELNVSQQAILKHINLLMRVGLIRAYEVKMGSLGPSRKYYELARPISLSINMLKGYSEIEFHDFVDEVPDHLKEALKFVEREVLSERLYEALSEVKSVIQMIDKELQEIRAKERALLSAKCKLLSLVQEALERLKVPLLERRRILESLLS